MRPSAPAPGVGAGDPPSCRPAGLPRFPKLPPTASLTARSTSLAQQLACPPLPAGLGPALPSGRLSTGIQPEEWNGVGRPQQPGPRDLGQAPPFAQHILLVASSLRSPRAGVTVQLPAPRYWDLSLGLSHPPPTAATGEHFQAQAQGGDGALPTRWTLLSSIYMFLLPPHGGSQDPGAWKEAVPQEPKKVSTSIIGALEPSHQASDGAARRQTSRPRGRPGGASRWRCAVCSHLGQQGPFLTCRSLSHPYTAHSSR